MTESDRRGGSSGPNGAETAVSAVFTPCTPPSGPFPGVRWLWYVFGDTRRRFSPTERDISHVYAALEAPGGSLEGARVRAPGGQNSTLL